jgi:hypothetical protein
MKPHTSMVKSNIVFQDLQEDVQEEVWALVSKHLLDAGWVERTADDTDADFQDRLWEATDQYINTHNVALEYQL